VPSRRVPAAPERHRSRCQSDVQARHAGDATPNSGPAQHSRLLSSTLSGGWHSRHRVSACPVPLVVQIGTETYYSGEMRDVAELPWRTVVGIFCAAVLVLMIAGVLRGGPVLSATALWSLPIAALMTFVGFAAIKRHYR
jgi:hypothetical protein